VTGLAQGDGTFLHLKYREFFDDFLQHGRPLPSDVHGVVLSPVALEVRPGRKIPDRLATLVAIEDEQPSSSDSGSENAFQERGLRHVNRSQLVFRYSVCDGDNTNDLE